MLYLPALLDAQILSLITRKLIKQHFSRLSEFIPSKYAQLMRDAYIQLITFFQQSDPAQADIRTKNQNLLIKLAREILDKAL
jgi:hypothetical protein